jgi:hypothetical protein
VVADRLVAPGRRTSGVQAGDFGRDLVQNVPLDQEFGQGPHV